MYIMSEEEKKWRRRDDARTLALAEQVKADKQRYAEAIEEAKEMAKEDLDRVQGMVKVAGLKTPKMPKNSNTIPNFKARYENPAKVK